ncbi:hypothetical protein Moror_5278 [Moniliophthora roreri MCA 2997]|uniref:Prolyl 4-hydroxylase alpha subunit Fe(2+) 2OG dioxygenase domain-containing protein n=2 Tax=Moniliophthora roreri TaxID=221103 RepID=V2X9G8_MONRO|nr:hypothetical protein Moror_5278 [Moniliophthora roreri MCA 2997]KAI3608909.1 hypothetical protein WG66_011024 [Moniliophthora roreri]
MSEDMHWSNNLEEFSHFPAIERIRSAVQDFSFVSGSCKASPESCMLFYTTGQADSAAETINLANTSDAQLASLKRVCEAASFGVGSQNVLDDTYRKALKLDASRFATSFDLCNTDILQRIQSHLVDTDTILRRHIRAERYKLNVYEEGAFFKAHRDTPRAENMFASLVVVFPVTHKGGTLVLSEKDHGWKFDAPQLLEKSTPSEPEIAFVAFYSDTTHQVLPVTTGNRVTLTYNLYFEYAAEASLLPPIASVPEPNKYSVVKEALQEILAEPKLFEEGFEDTVLCFGLAHRYPLVRTEDRPNSGYKVSELKKFLKGSDALIYRACKELGLITYVRVMYAQDEGDGPEAFLGTEFLNHNLEEVEGGLPTLCDEVGMEPLYNQRRDPDAAGLIWVTPGLGQYGIETVFVAYGNEPSLTSTYGEVCYHCQAQGVTVALM